MKRIVIALLSAVILLWITLPEECYADAYAYITNHDDNTVSMVDISDNAVVATINVGQGPRGVAITSNGNFVYITNNTDNTVSVISTEHKDTLTQPISVGSSPWGVAVDLSGDYVYVVNYLDGTVSVISDSTVTDTITVGNGPYGVAIDPDGTYVYVTNNTDGTVSVINTSDYDDIETITVGNGPYGVAIDPDGTYVYVTNNTDGTVSVINTSDYDDIETITVGSGPMGVAVNNSNDYIYVVNHIDATVSVISTSDYSLTATINVGNSPVSFGTFIGGTAPEAPSDLSATAESESRIDLSWTDNSNDEYGFKIERKRYGKTFSQIATVDANVTSYSDTGLSTYRTYYYRVRAYNNAGNSEYTDEADATTLEEESGCFIKTTHYSFLLKFIINIFHK
jgi:YVTN family beta-propeller protein